MTTPRSATSLADHHQQNLATPGLGMMVRTSWSFVREHPWAGLLFLVLSIAASVANTQATVLLTRLQRNSTAFHPQDLGSLHKLAQRVAGLPPDILSVLPEDLREEATKSLMFPGRVTESEQQNDGRVRQGLASSLNRLITGSSLLNNAAIKGVQFSSAAHDRLAQAAAAEASIPRLNRIVLSELLDLPRPASSRTTFGWWTALMFGGLVLGMAAKIAGARLEMRMNLRLQDRVFRAMLAQPPGFFHKERPGSLAFIATQMTTEAQKAMRSLILDPLVQVPAFCIAAGGILEIFRNAAQSAHRPSDPVSRILLSAWFLAGVVIVGAGLLMWLIHKAGTPLQVVSIETRKRMEAHQDFVTGAVSAPEEIRAFRAEEVFAEKQLRMAESLGRAKLRHSVTIEIVNFANSAPGIFLQLVLAGSAVIGLSEQPEVVGAVMGVVLLIPRVLEPAQMLSAYRIIGLSAWPSVQRVLDLLSASPSQASLPTPETLPRAADSQQTLVAENVSFRYLPELPLILDRVTVHFPPGKITGLIARMGQGKTTFFRLALRFYDPQSGKISVGGVSTIEVSADFIRRRVALMSQFPAFFHDTLRDNLRFARPEATDAEMEALCRRTGIWSILLEKLGDEEEQRRFPNPLDRQFSAGGTLSGGQKKLLALTRCLLLEPTHLLLDEPTTGMDNTSKRELIPVLRLACAAKTVVVVDHDLAWLNTFCDHFVVLDGGKVVQQGGRELAEEPGLFQELLGANIGRKC